MTIALFSPSNMTFSSDFYVVSATPRKGKDGKEGYKAFTVGVSKTYIDTYSLPGWDTSRFFLETILEAIKAKAILARQAGKNGVDLGENLPAFLASLSVGGRINKDDLVAWLKSINSFILA